MFYTKVIYSKSENLVQQLFTNFIISINVTGPARRNGLVGEDGSPGSIGPPGPPGEGCQYIGRNATNSK